LRGTAVEIVDKLNLAVGFGCEVQWPDAGSSSGLAVPGRRTCVAEGLAAHLTAREPKNLDQWLANSGWSEAQIGTFHDVFNINFWHYAMLSASFTP